MFKDVVLLDMDGVICNFVQGIIDSLKLDIVHGQYATWDYHRELGFTNEEMWAPTREAGWWENLKPYEWANSLMDSIRKHTDKIIFCTSPGLDHKCASEKVYWLRKHGFMDRSKNDFQIGPKKELNAMSGAVLIDDSDSNVIKYVEAAGRAILFPQPWNTNRDRLFRMQYLQDSLAAMRLSND